MADPSSGEHHGEADLPVGAYVAAFVAYVALGYVFRTAFLNWIVGPLFLVIVLYLAPKAMGRRR